MAIRWTDATPALRLPPLPGDAASIARSRPEGGVDVWISPQVDQEVMAHLSARDVEQGGLLIGQAFSDPRDGSLAHLRVLGCAPADDAHGTAFSLRMESSVWRAAQALLAPGDLIIGWYHSHPGLTAFFSDTDRKTQRAFFNHPYSVGWVIDPVSKEEALFLGAECTLLQRATLSYNPTAA